MVVLLADPWTFGLGTILGVGDSGWLWVEWVNGDIQLIDPFALELADRWERQQVERGTSEREAA